MISEIALSERETCRSGAAPQRNSGLNEQALAELRRELAGGLLYTPARQRQHRPRAGGRLLPLRADRAARGKGRDQRRGAGRAQGRGRAADRAARPRPRHGPARAVARARQVRRPMPRADRLRQPRRVVPRRLLPAVVPALQAGRRGRRDPPNTNCG